MDPWRRSSCRDARTAATRSTAASIFLRGDGSDPMVKLVFLLKRKDGMPFEDFVRYYETTHQRIGCRVMPGCVKYQRRYLRYLGQPVEGAHPEDRYDVVTELWFPDRATL